MNLTDTAARNNLTNHFYNGGMFVIMARKKNSLSVSYVKQLGTFVLASSEYDIKRVCEELGWKYTVGMDYKDGILMRFNPFTGELLNIKEFAPSKEYSYQNFSRGSTTGTDSTLRKTTQAGPESYHGANIIEWHTKSTTKRRNMSKEEVSFYSKPHRLIEMDEHEAVDYLKNLDIEV